MKTELTKEESALLISLGVPKEKASRRHIELTLEEYRVFDLADLLDILPKGITISGFKLPLMIEFDVDNVHAYYYCYRGFNANEEELIDALYKLCVWCLKNKYLKFE